ncbi:EAL and HDOD domain-containing protein [Enterobacter cloacae complex sp. 2024EL-00215]|uniref:HDOD domain-containing protein n=1 Tax=Enterobacter mori TaxID=539813 RepID=A0A7T0DZF4_9ENTR|nr:MULTISPECIES: HDOD domain-containing protein [Enterobacter]MBA7853515.1 HDOD domain-containing protein [Enterobacter sp. RHBSTW-00901]QPK02218.1 HDOD domain-containing protein [Enterobacter mori]BBS36780.1 diguanylate phosphodiesterase [Enterobacter cloacae]
MYAFIARQPIFNTDMNTVAYELLFRDGMTNRFPDVSAEYATSRMISDQFLCVPSQQIAGTHTSFINFPSRMVIDRSGEALDKDNVVVEILEDAVPGDELLQAVKEMNAHGYRFALDDFTLAPEWDVFLPYISILKFDVRNNTLEQIENYLQQRKKLTGHIKYLAEKVETKEEFKKYRDAGFSLFQGYFFCRPEIIKYKRLSQNQLAIFRLQMEIGRNKPDFRIIESLIKTDLTLSYKIMRYMKHTAFKYCSACNFSKLTLSEVLRYLGENQLRRFVAVVVLASAGNDTVNELYPLSMMRGKFCELITEKMGEPTQAENAFLCGLFSLLDTILELPMTELMKQIAVPQSVSNALCHQEGLLADIVTLCRYYEQQEWDEATRMCNVLGLSDEDVVGAMRVATIWAGENAAS